MKRLNELVGDTVDFVSFPAVENGVLLNGFAKGGYLIVRTLKENDILPIFMGTGSKLSISFAQPNYYDSFSTRFRVAFTPWESTQLPNPYWVDTMNLMDTIWAPTPWVRQVFRDSGVVVPIEVAQEGIDPNEHTVTDHKNVSGPFTFIHVGEPAVRKNGKMVVDAFKRTFGRNDDVRLVIKAMKTTEIQTTSKRIDIDTSVMTTAQMDKLYQKVHCMVYPSSGEGFGRIPIEAMASGLPVILTPYSGMEVFSQYGIELDYTVGPTGDPFNKGEWAHVDFDSLCEKMRYAYESYDTVAERAYQNAPLVRESFPYDAGILSALFKTLERVAV